MKITNNKNLALVYLFFIISLILVSCSSTPKATPPKVVASRCVPASNEQLERIRIGVKDIEEDNDIKSGWSVKSKDFEQVWFVAARIYGTGIENGTEPALWAISGELNKPGMTLSVNGFAKSFSSWPDGSTTDAAVSMYDDGAQEAIGCASQD